MISGMKLRIKPLQGIISGFQHHGLKVTGQDFIATALKYAGA